MLSVNTEGLSSCVFVDSWCTLRSVQLEDSNLHVFSFCNVSDKYILSEMCTLTQGIIMRPGISLAMSHSLGQERRTQKGSPVSVLRILYQAFRCLTSVLTHIWPTVIQFILHRLLASVSVLMAMTCTHSILAVILVLCHL
jgi:hypothetical protein